MPLTAPRAIPALTGQSDLLATPPSSKLSILDTATDNRDSHHLDQSDSVSPFASPSDPRSGSRPDPHTMGGSSPYVSPTQGRYPVSRRQDFLRDATPLSSRPGSSTSSPTSEPIGPNSNLVKASPPRSQRVQYEDAVRRQLSAEGLQPASAIGTAPQFVPNSGASAQTFASIVAGKGSAPMSKWLPNSTLALAEPLEKGAFDSTSGHRLASPDSGLLTPPFTPLKRVDEKNSLKTPIHSHLRAFEKFHSRQSLLTPPDTLKHDQIRRTSPSRGNLFQLTPEAEVTLNSPGSVKSPRSLESARKQTKQTSDVKVLAQQFKHLLAAENQRPRSISSPTEATFEFNNYPQLAQLLGSNLGPNPFHSLTVSSDEEVAEFRKRADSFCTTPSVPLSAPIVDNSPQGVSSFPNQNLNTTLLASGNGRVNQVHGASSFPTRSASIFANSLSSAHAFSSPAPFALATERLGESPEFLSPRRRQSSASPQKSQHSNPPSPATIAPTSNDRHQRHHTAPASNSPPFKGVRAQSFTAEHGDRFNQELTRNECILEDRAMPITEPLQAKITPSRFVHPTFRPRSSTIADSGIRRRLGKSQLSVNWDDTESNEPASQASRPAEGTSMGRGQAEDSTQMCVADLDQALLQHMQFGPDFTMSSTSFDASALSRNSDWNFNPSALLTRYCKVLGISPKLLGSMKGIVRVRNAFAEYGDLLDIYVDTLSPLGFILLGFHDVRSVANMMDIGLKPLESAFGSFLKFEPVQRHEVIQLTQDVENPILSTNEGILKLHFEDPRGIITQPVLTEYLQRYGELKALRLLGMAQWLVEWFDDRHAFAAKKQLVARDFADFQVTVDLPDSWKLRSEAQLLGLPLHHPSITDHLSINTGLSSNACLLPPTIRPPPMINPNDQYNSSFMYRYVSDPYTTNYLLPPWSQPLPAGPVPALYQRHPTVPIVPESLAFTPQNVHATERHVGGQRMDAQHPYQNLTTTPSRPRAFPFPGVPPSNVIDLDRIECGSDPRTTCMIKNIPNKITDEMLFKFINEVCPRGFDFLYLRMDFKARLNVGYAFINFLSVENVLKFAKSKLGVKWGVFLSEKTVQMCYASIQGKENLIEKFRNSAIMEEEESFRPKVYHSSGALMGLPEPFPHANDLQRKARSQANAALLARPPMGGPNNYNQ